MKDIEKLIKQLQKIMSEKGVDLGGDRTLKIILERMGLSTDQEWYPQHPANETISFSDKDIDVLEQELHKILIDKRKDTESYKGLLTALESMRTNQSQGILHLPEIEWFARHPGGPTTSSDDDDD